MNLDKYKIISLAELLTRVDGEDIFWDTIQDFSCPVNEDVEHFLKQTALTNQRMGISRTNLIYSTSEPEPVLLGYYSLAMQVLDLERIESKTLRRKITGFKRENKLGAAVYLIGQLGKNFSHQANKLISGQEIFMLAMQDILEARYHVGGRIVVVECKNEEHLRNFYANTLKFQLIDTTDDESMLKYMTLLSAYEPNT